MQKGNQAKVNQVEQLLNQGTLKIDEGQNIQVVVDPEESEFIRLSQYDDA